MFFAPTLLALLQNPDYAPHVHSLCLSTGDADGLGDTRVLELERSLDVLGVRKGNRRVVDHPALRDNITAEWDAAVIGDFVWQYITEHNIKAVLTFDSAGVSGHPNHKSLPQAISALAAGMEAPFASDPSSSSPRVFTLVSEPLFKKYTGPLGAVLARLTRSTDSLVFTSSVKQYRQALAAMQAHESQLVWFRWLYVHFSRYMWINEWKRLPTPTSHAQGKRGDGYTGEL
ncbi:PIGL family protein [Pleurotus pulmonarius]